MAEIKRYERPSGNPTTFRALAIVLWVLGIAAEVVGILILLRVLMPNVENYIWFIVAALIIDLILVVAGSFLWKRANKIDPPSEKNKVEFFIKTQLGAIIAVIAFFPILILLLTDKNLDGRAKALVSILAAVCLAAAVGLSADWNPVSAEDLELLKSNTQQSDFGTGNARWTSGSGEVYHTWAECSALNRIGAGNLAEGDVDGAFAAKKVRLCAYCAKHFDIYNAGVVGFDPDALADGAAAAADAAGDAADAAGDAAEDLAEAA
ncbi:MAG: hypothetical protein FWG00_00800 [Coriobacteriia bacterium]|jgi:hypothetical protein|nr:hypothetical protein [Coriobacteriia bacterium]MDR2714846.1 hypothetical protein [Coriobacteriales bacterium]